MKVGIIDADILDSGTRFPNLVCEKLSGYNKDLGHEVQLITDYKDITNYDKVYMACVFSFTKIPLKGFEGNHDHPNLALIKSLYPNLTIGGTGFFWKDASNLPYEIEHHLPDYHLYDDFIDAETKRGIKPKLFNDYRNVSIGFTTRGCFRKCSFCVNEKYDRVFNGSPVNEFLDKDRKYICLLDDNVFAFRGWEEVFKELNATGKPFQFKQGLDIRLLTDQKAKVLAESKYHGDYIFAFDDIKDREIIEKKLDLWHKYSSKIPKLYVLCGYESQDEKDIVNTFERVKILMKHQSLPYIMRHENYLTSKYKGMYIALACWCNQPVIFKKKSFREFCELRQSYIRTPGKICANLTSLTSFEKEHPEIAKEYFDMKWEDFIK